MKKVKLLSVLLLAGAVTLAGCNNGGGDTSSAPSSEPTSGSTSEEPVVVKDWSDELKSLMTKNLDGLVLPYIEGTWSGSYSDGVLALRAKDATVEAGKKAFKDAKYTDVSEGTSVAFTKKTTHGTVQVELSSKGSYKLVIEAMYLLDPADHWREASKSLMKEILDEELPFPTGLWYDCQSMEDYSGTKYVVSASYDAKFEDIYDVYSKATGYIAAVTSAGVYASKSRTVTVDEEEVTEYVNVGFLDMTASGAPGMVMMQAYVGSTPIATDEFELYVSAPEVHVGDEVMLSVKRGNAVTGEVEFSFEPENALVPVEDKPGFYTVAVEDGIVVTAKIGDGSKYQSSAQLTGVDPSTPIAPQNWSAEDLAAFKQALLADVSIPRPYATWSAVEYSYFYGATTNADDTTTDIVAYEFAKAGFLVAPDPEYEGDYIFSSSEDIKYNYGSYTLYVDGYIYNNIDGGVTIQLGYALNPTLSDKITFEGSAKEFHTGDEITLVSFVGNTIEATPTVVVDPEEGGATLKSYDAETLSNGVQYTWVYTLDASTESLDTPVVVTFSEKFGSFTAGEVAVDVYNPAVKFAWTDEEIALMEEHLGVVLPFFGVGWKAEYNSEAEMLYVSVNKVGIMSELPAKLSAAGFITLSSESFAYPFEDGVGLYAIYEETGYTYFIKYNFVTNAEDWDSDSKSLMTDELGEVLPFVPCVFDKWQWNSEYEYAYSFFYNISSETYAAAFGEDFEVEYDETYHCYTATKGLEPEEVSGGFVEQTLVVDVYDNGKIEAYVVKTMHYDAYPVDLIVDYIKTTTGSEELAPTVVALVSEGANFVYDNDGGVTVYLDEAADAEAVAAAYGASLANDYGYVYDEDYGWYFLPENEFDGETWLVIYFIPDAETNTISISYFVR